MHFRVGKSRINPSCHCENKFLQCDVECQLLFGSGVQGLTNSAAPVSFHFSVALYFQECQVSILEKRMPNLVLLEQVGFQKRFWEISSPCNRS